MPVPTKESVVAKLSEMYGVDADQAKLLLGYDMVVRGRLNRMHATAQIAEAVELRGGALSEGTEAAKEIASAIPVFGSIAGLVGYGINKGAKALERHFKIGEAARVSAMNPSGDVSEWCAFTKDLSAGFIAARVDKIKDMTATQVRELAQKDSDAVASAILEGRVTGHIYDITTSTNLIDVVKGKEAEKSSSKTLTPSTSPGARSVAKLAGNSQQHGHTAAAA